MSDQRPAKLEGYRDSEVARGYDARWSDAAGRRRDRRKSKALLRALDQLARSCGAPPRRLLDVPCGTGRFVRLLRQRGYSYCGADLSPAMLREAQLKAAGACWCAADLARLPFAAASFDVALCIRLFHLVRDPRLRRVFLQELGRVSRLGFIVDYRHSRTLRVQGRRLRHRLGLRPRPPGNPSPRQIRAELAAAGFPRHLWLPVHFAPCLSDKVLIVALHPADDRRAVQPLA